MEKDKKNRDLKLEAFLARESAKRKRAASLSESPETVDQDLDRLVEEERNRHVPNGEEEESKKT